ncbi:NAD-dependent epimerase/dehydratase family protein [Photobacterium leiognathi]|uniref:UDP-glucose 4-epimerase n=1 Tax=Photobacterium leiognathi TaxID=553611 RepID=A0ABX5GBL7_PHOLE|nr:NAD-dependent epimerase/dehydratase family protein [Photobacterium leiognathi]KJF90576.1 UDP-glucose 4-epimerase [Photobacterium leiognathi]PSV78648.1 UDP-glucose 4-epimerase [Photobacterium leiognathi]
MILLTGSNGFIGSELYKTQSSLFKIVSRHQKGIDCFKVQSIDSETNWNGAFDNIHCIIHLAGLAHSSCHTAEELYEVNTRGTLKLAEDAVNAGVRRFIFVSSIGVNGSVTKSLPFNSNSKPAPHNNYSLSKLKAEQELLELARNTGLEVVIVRPTLVYGVNAPGNFGLLTKLVKKSPVLPFGLVNNKRSFISVKNLCDLLLVCAKHESAPGHVFLASDGEPISTKEFTNAITKGLGKSVYQLPIPLWCMRFGARLVGKKSISEQLLDNLEVDSSNIFDVLGWVPPYSMEQVMSSLSKE